MVYPIHKLKNSIHFCLPGVVVSWVLMSAEASWGFVGFLGLGFGRDLRDDVLLLVSVGGEREGEEKK